MTNILHIQYPVGQGGLHLGIIGNVAYIYDCGSVQKTRLDDYINDVVHILKGNYIAKLYIFISHLHEDHCNGLIELVNQVQKYLNIKVYIYLPYISDLEKICLLFDSLLDYTAFMRKITDLQNVEITYLADTRSYKKKIQDTREKVQTYAEFNKLNLQHIFLFDVFVYDAFCAKKMVWFKKRIKTILAKDDLLDALTDKVKKAELQNLYKKLSGDINYTSLCLFVGVNQSIDNVVLYSEYKCCVCCNIECKQHDFDNNLKPWLHTGDYCLQDLNMHKFKTKFQDHYQEKLESELFFQIPHHGSKNSIDFDILKLNTNNTMFFTGEIFPRGRKQPKRNYTLFSIISNKKLVSECSYSGIQIKGKII